MSWLLSPAGAVTSIDLIGDVDITGAADGDLLFRSGGDWVDTAGDLTWDGVTLTVDGDLIIANGADSVEFTHDGTDFDAVFTNTADWNISGLTNVLLDNVNLRVTGSLQSIYTEFDRQTSEIRVTPSGAGNGFWLRNGTEFRFYDTTDTDYLQLAHDGTDVNITQSGTAEVNFLFNGGIPLQFGPTNTAGLRFGTSNLFVRQEVALADDATATFDVGNYAFVVVVSTFNSTANSIAFWTTTQAPLDIGSGSNVSLGTGSNPDVDTNVNIWKSDANTFNIKNRLGSSRTFSILIFTPLAT